MYPTLDLVPSHIVRTTSPQRTHPTTRQSPVKSTKAAKSSASSKRRPCTETSLVALRVVSTTRSSGLLVQRMLSVTTTSHFDTSTPETSFLLISTLFCTVTKLPLPTFTSRQETTVPVSSGARSLPTEAMPCTVFCGTRLFGAISTTT